MMALLVTLLLFVVAGAAAASALRLTVPGTIPGRIGYWFLAGISATGTTLYFLGTMGVPVTALTVGALALVALGVVMARRAHLRHELRVRHHWAANVMLYVPLTALLATAALLPIRDYDGRVTWLPKARAIAHDAAIDGPFFQGQAGLNLHNEYPLLMPLNAAAVMIAVRCSEPEAARWLYVLVAIAALLAARDLIAVSQPQSAGWVVAAAAWLPMLLSIEGGALAAYNDVTVLALVGVSVVSLGTRELGGAGVRAAALFLPALVLCKNEGVVLALSILLSFAIALRFRDIRGWMSVLVPVIAAVALLLVWRGRVPAAYDEQYDVLIRTLPDVVYRLPTALKALVSHGVDVATWGWFWPVSLLAALVAVGRRRRYAGGPILVMLFTACAYSITFAVTSWNIPELAQVAASRLLLHIVIPACFVAAIAGESVCTRLACPEGVPVPELTERPSDKGLS